MPGTGNPIGTLIKPHGYIGEMHLKGTSGNILEFEKGMWLFIQKDGQRIPFFIEYFDPDTSGERGIIKLEFIDSDTEARKFTGCPVFEELHPTGKPDSSASPEGYVGSIIADTVSGREFEVTGFMDHPENPLLILESDNEEVLLPVNADFFQKARSRGRKLSMKFPDGLIQ